MRPEAGLTRGAQLLTHRTIETLRPTEAPYRVPDERCKGLAVRVAPSGVRTWDLAYRIRGTGKMRRLSLGKRTLAPILQRYAADVRRRDIREILDAMADQGKGREAEKRRQVCTAMFRWALSQDIVETDPTAGLEAHDRGIPRDRTLTVKEIETLWKWLDSDALSLEAADILKLELLTGAGAERSAGFAPRRSIAKNGLGHCLLGARKMGVSG